MNMHINAMKKTPLVWITGSSTLILFTLSSLRHTLFQSNALDLGWFDQATYLISQGETPIVSFAGATGFHILGDHAAVIFYLLSLFYKIYPSVYWLFAIQAIALASGGIFMWHLARQARLTESLSLTMVAVYLLYPLVFNVNLFDFHPEVLAVPGLMGAVLAARAGQVVWFCLSLVLVLSCKAVLSLTVVAMGIWLLIFEKKRWCGAIALFAGIAWFMVATQWMIPTFNSGGVAAVSRYTGLGHSPLEIAKNVLTQPWLVLGRIFTLPNLEYLALLFAPVVWGLSWQNSAPLLVISPTLFLNLLAEYPAQKDLVHQYSLPALPFLLLAVLATLTTDRGWLRNRKWMLLWVTVAFMALAQYSSFASRSLQSLDTWQATRAAITQVQTNGGILVPAQVAPHLTHRPMVKLTTKGSETSNLSLIDYVMLNFRHPGWASSPEVMAALRQRLEQMPEFQLSYHQEDVFLFERKRHPLG